MQQILDELQQKKKFYTSLCKKSDSFLKKEQPDGGLRVQKCHGTYQYYHVTQKGDTYGHYIKKEAIDIAQKLAQRDYNKHVLKTSQKAISMIDTFLLSFPREEIKNIDTKSIGRRKLITPYVLSDDEFVNKWVHHAYEVKGFGDDKNNRIDENAAEYEDDEICEGKDITNLSSQNAKYYTDKGERVRSKSEVIIANKLNYLGIPYRYEYPIFLRGLGKVFPDFCILNVRTRKEIILEHFGMMDTPEYSNRACNKMNIYARNGYLVGRDILYTFETNFYPLDTKVLEKILKLHCL